MLAAWFCVSFVSAYTVQTLKWLQITPTRALLRFPFTRPAGQTYCDFACDEAARSTTGSKWRASQL